MSVVISFLTKVLICFVVGNLAVLFGFGFCFFTAWILNLIKDVFVGVLGERFKYNTERIFMLMIDGICTITFLSLVVFCISTIGYVCISIF